MFTHIADFYVMENLDISGNAYKIYDSSYVQH